MAADSAVEKMLRKTSESDTAVMNEGACLCLFDSKAARMLITVLAPRTSNNTIHKERCKRAKKPAKKQPL
jgi:hypothetical protein